MKLQLLVCAPVDFFTAEQSNQAGADVKPTLFKNHGFKGSMARSSG
jgi:hypothetical protein